MPGHCQMIRNSSNHLKFSLTEAVHGWGWFKMSFHPDLVENHPANRTG